MKQVLFTLLIGTIATAGYSQEKVIHDPNAEVRTVSGFHAIHVSGGIDLYLSQGNEEAVAVSASEVKYRGNIKTEVKDGVLNISYLNTGRYISFGNKKLRAYVSFKTLDNLTASGASDVNVNGTINATDLQVHLSGASDFKGAITAVNLAVHISGASDMTLGGTANSLNVHASGASDFKGYNMVAQICDVEATGASDIRITCDKEMNASASGASDIHIKGNGVIKKMHNSGASSVKKV